MWWLAITILVLGLFGGAILRQHLREAKLLRLREISHQERMVAMERGLPLSNSDAESLDSLLVDPEGAEPRSNRMSTTGAHWTRLTALALGLVLLCTGFGLIPGLYYQSDSETSGAWPVGLIPILIGAGLLIFVWLSRDLADRIDGSRESR
jgi:hypothetical protein